MIPDEEVILISDIRAHERIPRPEDIIELESLEVGAVIEESPASNNAVIVSECPICMDVFESAGAKRCVVTKCGHIFCYSCITTVMTDINSTCPKCRSKLGKRNSLIALYDTLVRVVDKSSVDAIQVELNKERSKRVKLDAEIAKSRQREADLRQKLSAAERMIKTMQSSSRQTSSSITQSSTCQSNLQTSLHLRDENEYTVQKNSLHYGDVTQLQAQPYSSSFTESGQSHSSALFQLVRSEPLEGAKAAKVLSTWEPDDTLLIGSRMQGEGGLTYYFIRKQCQIFLREKPPAPSAPMQAPVVSREPVFGTFGAAVRDIASSPHPCNNDLICVASNEKVARLMSHWTGELLCTLDTGHCRATCCCFSATRECEIWVAGSAGCLLLFDLRDTPSYAHPVRVVTISPPTSLVSSSSLSSVSSSSSAAAAAAAANGGGVGGTTVAPPTLLNSAPLGGAPDARAVNTMLPFIQSLCHVAATPDGRLHAYANASLCAPPSMGPETATTQISADSVSGLLLLTQASHLWSLYGDQDSSGEWLGLGLGRAGGCFPLPQLVSMCTCPLSSSSDCWSSSSSSSSSSSGSSSSIDSSRTPARNMSEVVCTCKSGRCASLYDVRCVSTYGGNQGGRGCTGEDNEARFGPTVFLLGASKSRPTQPEPAGGAAVGGRPGAKGGAEVVRFHLHGPELHPASSVTASWCGTVDAVYTGHRCIASLPQPSGVEVYGDAGSGSPKSIGAYAITTEGSTFACLWTQTQNTTSTTSSCCSGEDGPRHEWSEPVLHFLPQHSTPIVQVKVFACRIGDSFHKPIIRAEVPSAQTNGESHLGLFVACVSDSLLTVHRFLG